MEVQGGTIGSHVPSWKDRWGQDCRQGPSWGRPAASRGGLGGVLEASWAVLERFGSLQDASRTPKDVSGAILRGSGASWKDFGGSRGVLCEILQELNFERLFKPQGPLETSWNG